MLRLPASRISVVELGRSMKDLVKSAASLDMNELAPGDVEEGNSGGDDEAAINPEEAPRPLVICGPSGSGKSTILKAVMAQDSLKDRIAFSVSHTTRKPRPGEQHGREYYFVDRDKMLQEIKEDKFIETAEFSGNLYGTSKASVRTCRNQGKICVLDIDSQGVRSMKKIPNLRPIYAFIRPPSISALEARLRGRKTETEESLKRRLAAAEQEMRFGAEAGNFDVTIVNDDLSAAIAMLKRVVESCLDSKKKEETGKGDMHAISRNGVGRSGLNTFVQAASVSDGNDSNSDLQAASTDNGNISNSEVQAASTADGDTNDSPVLNGERGEQDEIPVKKSKSVEKSRDSTPGLER